MRFSSIFTLLLTLAALVLSLLCLFAGTSKSFLQSGDILTLNVSRLGHTEVFNTTDGDGGFFSSLVNDVQGDINDLINDATSDIASTLNLTDFYSVHIMNYCDGFYEPNTTAKNPSKNTTYCSSRRAIFHFNPTAVVEEALPAGITLDDLHWPSEIQDAARAIRVASIAMFVFYVIGIIFTGSAALGAVATIFADGRLSAMLNFCLDILAFLSLGIASALATSIMFKAVHAVNKYGGEIGIAAYKGTTFLGMTWGATVAMLVAALLSIAQCVAGRKKKQSYGEKTY